jgi:hypothetical protein
VLLAQVAVQARTPLREFQSADMAVLVGGEQHRTQRRRQFVIFMVTPRSPPLAQMKS